MYKFKSKAASDILMTAAHGDQLLTLLGRTPGPQGIVEAADLPGAISALERAIAEEEAAAGRPTEDPGTGADDDEADDARGAAGAVSLRQRAWPLLEMMKRAQAGGDSVVWGV